MQNNTTSVNNTFVIGKAKTMYTLYSVLTDGNKQIYSFVKIVSKDLNKVKALYPGLEIDETLHGKFVERIASVKSMFDDFKTNNRILGFKFNNGKYKNYLVDDVNDLSYLCYVYNLNYFKDINIAIKKRALELGAIEILGKLYVEGSKNFNNAKKLFDVIENKSSVEYTFLVNPNELGEIKDYDSQYTFIFDNLKIGKFCTMPIDETGKARKIANKKIIIIDGYVEYHNGYDNLFVIKKFKLA